LLGALVLTAAVFAACGDRGGGSGFGEPNGGAGGGGGGDQGGSLLGDADLPGEGGVQVDALVFDPPSATITVDGVTAGTASFSLKATKGGNSFVVAPQSIQFDRPDLAKAQIGSPVVLTAPGQYAGTGTLHGVYGGKEATAKLTVNVALKEVGPGVDPQAVAALGGAGLPQDPSLTTLLYPYDQTVFPLGITTPLLMWNAPGASDAYRLHLEEQHYTYDGYFAVVAPGQLRVAQGTWDRITASNGGDALKATLARWDSAQKTAYTSATETWTISPASLRGAIYYWTTSKGGHMSRIRPGTGATPEVLNGGKCMGCHAVSADGSTLVAAVEGLSTAGSPAAPNQTEDRRDGRPWLSFDLPNATVRQTSNVFSGNVAVNPDGKYTVFGDQRLYLADTATGQVLTSGLESVALDPGMKGLMTPAFAPDGKHLAAVEGAGNWYHNLVGGKLVVLDFDEATKQFTNLKGLAPASSFAAGQRAIAYPTFAPDSQWLAFHVADYATGCDAQGCDDNAKQIGSLWMQSTAGAGPVKLDKLNDGAPRATDHNLSLEPTFNPVERGGYFWVVFTSMRDWGNKITGISNNGKKRLWVGAIDKTVGAVDPSHPPFFLEGQEETTTNMRGFWALAACMPSKGGGACQAGFECCSGFCDKGVCVDSGALACKGAGDACTADDDCCNAGAVQCIAGHCTPVTPR
jgi:hypothetical protein